VKPEHSVNVRQAIERGRVHPRHDVLQEGLSGLRGTPSKVRKVRPVAVRYYSDLDMVRTTLQYYCKLELELEIVCLPGLI